MPRAASESISFIVSTVGDVVKVLNAYDRRDRLGLLDLLGGDGAEAEVLEKTLLLELDQRRGWFRDCSQLGAFEFHDAKVHDVQRVEPEMVEVVVNGLSRSIAASATEAAGRATSWRTGPSAGGLGPPTSRPSLPRCSSSWTRRSTANRLDSG
jgi:hypothetical protein